MIKQLNRSVPSIFQKNIQQNKVWTQQKFGNNLKDKGLTDRKNSQKRVINFLIISGMLLVIIIVAFKLFFMKKAVKISSESLFNSNQHPSTKAETQNILDIQKMFTEQVITSTEIEFTILSQMRKRIEKVKSQINQMNNKLSIEDKKIMLIEKSKNIKSSQIQNLNKIVHNAQKQIIKQNQKLAVSREQINKIKQLKNTFQIQLNAKTFNRKKFQVPKLVWIYKSDDKNQLIDQFKINNRQYWIKESGYQLRQIDQNSISKWIQLSSFQNLKMLISQIKSIIQNKNQYKNNWRKIKKTLVVLTALKQIGGVYIDNDYIFTQKLNWIEDIKENIHINVGNSYSSPKVFGFYSPQGSTLQKFQNKQFKVEVDRYMIKSPALRDYFLAALPQTDFISKVLDQYIDFLKNQQNIQKQIKQNKFDVGNLMNEAYIQLFTLATTVVCQLKQKQLNHKNKLFKDKYDLFAIDQFGLFSINSFYFPEKFHFYFNHGRTYRSFNYLGKMPQQEFQKSIGPIRYIAKPDAYPDLREQIKRGLKKQSNSMIIENSFLHNHLLLNKKYDFVHQNKEKTFQLTHFQKWNNLPKILWLFWDKGFDNAPVGNQLCVFNLKRNAQAAGFEVNIISESNAKDFLSGKTLELINHTILNHKLSELRLQTKSDLYRLALLSAHGGIYLDSSYVFIQDFNWIINIAGQHSSYIFNRYGTVPKVLMQFHPIYGGIFDWQVNQKANTKDQWHEALQSNFIAAEKDNQYIKEWFDMMIFFMTNTYETTYKKMVECLVDGQRWTRSPTNRYLIVMDALKVVIGCKQKQLRKQQNHNQKKYANAMDYYKIWSINGFIGFQKFRSETNFANAQRQRNDDNLFIYRYSQEYVQKIVGKTYKTFKMYKSGMDFLNELLNKNYYNLQSVIHPDSIFSKYMYKRTDLQLYKTDKVHAKQRKKMIR